MHQRPNWIDYFMNIAFLVSQRSHDIQTQHGCVITDKDNRILSVGYNGFPRGAKDGSLPTTRPEKYDWMIHSEENAVANCVVRPDDGIAYVTGQCCNRCIMTLWQHGIRKVYMANRHGSMLLNAETKAVFDNFIETTGLEVYYVDVDLTLLDLTYQKFTQ